MIRIFEGHEAPGMNPILDGMHRARKQVFVDLLGWDVPVVANAFEIDQFDDDHAIYVVVSDDDGHHDGSIRLLPSDRPHVLGSVFPFLCDDKVPTGPDVFELSRLCLSRSLRASRRLEVRNALATAVVQFALQRRIRFYSCVADSNWLSQIVLLGWTVRPLGIPQMIAGLPTGALLIEIDAGTPRKLEAAGTNVPMRITSTFAIDREAA
ncbi:MAG: acyl-homoserine-lactone synthase [Novosphingobium sp.]